MLVLVGWLCFSGEKKKRGYEFEYGKGGKFWEELDEEWVWLKYIVYVYYKRVNICKGFEIVVYSIFLV